MCHCIFFGINPRASVSHKEHHVILYRATADIVKRSHTSEVSYLQPESRALEAFGVSMLKYAFYVLETLFSLIAGSLKSANWSILAVQILFNGWWEKNQDFMLIGFYYPSNMIDCGGDH